MQDSLQTTGMRNATFWIYGSLLILFVMGCAFKFEITGQKTALENQVMGSYKELDDETMMMASVRGVGTDGQVKVSDEKSAAQRAAVAAKQNQEFNRDDLDDLRERQLIGEAQNGDAVVLPSNVGLVKNANPQDIAFANYIVSEENRDRKAIIARIIASNENLTEKDKSGVIEVYRKEILQKAPGGTWVESSGNWTQKGKSTALSVTKDPEPPKKTPAAQPNEKNANDQAPSKNLKKKGE